MNFMKKWDIGTVIVVTLISLLVIGTAYQVYRTFVQNAEGKKVKEEVYSSAALEEKEALEDYVLLTKQLNSSLDSLIQVNGQLKDQLDACIVKTAKKPVGRPKKVTVVKPKVDSTIIKNYAKLRDLSLQLENKYQEKVKEVNQLFEANAKCAVSFDSLNTLYNQTKPFSIMTKQVEMAGIVVRDTMMLSHLKVRAIPEFEVKTQKTSLLAPRKFSVVTRLRNQYIEPDILRYDFTTKSVLQEVREEAKMEKRKRKVIKKDQKDADSASQYSIDPHE